MYNIMQYEEGACMRNGASGRKEGPVSGPGKADKGC